jgi:hypothetical protein
MRVPERCRAQTPLSLYPVGSGAIRLFLADDSIDFVTVGWDALSGSSASGFASCSRRFGALPAENETPKWEAVFKRMTRRQTINGAAIRSRRR